jgi:hypothetical protein
VDLRFYTVTSVVKTLGKIETFGERVISFCRELDFKSTLPPEISIMNPFQNNPDVINVITQFYSKFYNDNKPRHLILGINPGRFGAGVTGIPFTDTKRLREQCGIIIPGQVTFETSSVFIYDVINQYGGPEKFYSDFYINSVCPLGFTARGKNGKEVNYNYYDNNRLTEAVQNFIIWNIRKQIKIGANREVCFCFGTGKNFKYLSELNLNHHFFETIVPLEHPRFIMQYRSKQKKNYIEKYLEAFRKV